MPRCEVEGEKRRLSVGSWELFLQSSVGTEAEGGREESQREKMSWGNLTPRKGCGGRGGESKTVKKGPTKRLSLGPLSLTSQLSPFVSSRAAPPRPRPRGRHTGPLTGLLACLLSFPRPRTLPPDGRPVHALRQHVQRRTSPASY